MSFFSKPRSPLGYYMANKTHDSYGVDHSNFSTRDELEYQWARIEKEQSLMEQEDTLGLSDNYTQYGTNFWGTDPENNYGFGYSALKPETFQSALSIQKQAQLSPQLETPDILDANALTPDTLGEKQPSWLDDILVAQNQLQNGSFGGGLSDNTYLNNNTFGLSENNYLNNNAFASNGTNNYLDNTYLNNNTFGLSENNYLNNNAFASNDVNGYLDNSYLNNNTFGLGENNYLNNNAFASNGTNSYLDNTYLNNNTFGLGENNYLNNNAFASNDTNNYLDNNVITTNEYDSLFAPLPLNQNSVRFADNPATNMATANNLDWGAIYKALFGVKPAVASTLDGQGINNQLPEVEIPTEEELWADFESAWPKIQKNENFVPHPYLDSKCLDTGGTGHLINLKNLKNDPSIDFSNPQRRENYLKLSQKMKDEICYIGPDGKLKTDWTYQKQKKEFPELLQYPIDKDLDKKVAFEFFKKRVPQVLYALAIQEPSIKWRDVGPDGKYVFFDLLYNAGEKTPIFNFKLKKTFWPKFFDAYAKGDYERAKKEVTRKGVSEERNRDLQYHLDKEKMFQLKKSH